MIPKYKQGDKVTMKSKYEILNSKEYKELCDIGRPYIDKLCNRFNTKTLTIDEWAMDLRSDEDIKNDPDFMKDCVDMYTTEECKLFFEDWLFTQE